MGDSTIRAEITMPKSLIMGEAALSKSPEQEEKELLWLVLWLRTFKQKRRGE